MGQGKGENPRGSSGPYKQSCKLNDPKIQQVRHKLYICTMSPLRPVGLANFCRAGQSDG